MHRKLLALHGYSQCGAMFSKKSGALRRKFKKENIEMVFPDAPFELLAEQIHGTYNEDQPPRGWWTFENNTYQGVDQSLQTVTSILAKEQAEGILAFSQGACLAGILSAIHSTKPIRSFSQIKYLIFAGSFIPTCENYRSKFKFYMDGQYKISIPSFHIYGAEDQFVQPEKSIEFANLFKNPVIAEHDGGHFIPSSGETMDKLLDFVAETTNNSKSTAHSQSS